MKTTPSNVFDCAKHYRTMSSGWQGAPYFTRYGRELVSKPRTSFKSSWGGYHPRTTSILLAYPSPSAASVTPPTRGLFHFCCRRRRVTNDDKETRRKTRWRTEFQVSHETCTWRDKCYNAGESYTTTKIITAKEGGKRKLNA